MATLPITQPTGGTPTTKDFMSLQTLWSAILNRFISQPDGYIGEVRQAFLTESQFQQQAGNGWVLCDGRTVPTSSYFKLTGKGSIPDMRGTSPRMKDNAKGLNPAGDLTLGSFQPDQFQSHHHDFGGTATNTALNITSDANAYGGIAVGTTPIGTITIAAPITDGITAVRTGAETCSKSTTINFFIRIN